MTANTQVNNTEIHIHNKEKGEPVNFKGENRSISILMDFARLLECTLHRFPEEVPGRSHHIYGRRAPNPFPGGKFLNIDDPEEETQDIVAPIYTLEGTTYDETNEEVEEEESFSHINPMMISFSSQELNFGMYWPSLSEIKELLHAYVQDSQTQQWYTLPLTSRRVDIKRYSPSCQDLQQVCTITIRGFKNGAELTTKCLLHLTGSNLTPIKTDTQKYVQFINHSTISNVVIVNLFSKRVDAIKEVDEEGQPIWYNIEESTEDEQYLLCLENKRVTTCDLIPNNGKSIKWKDDGNGTVTGIFKFVFTEGVKPAEYPVYKFAYENHTLDDYTDVVYDPSIDKYVTEQGTILDVFKNENSEEGFMVVGCDENQQNITETFKPHIRVVENFRE